MTFSPGQSGNPSGRPRKPGDPRSEDLQEFCRIHREDIRRVGEIVLKRALRDDEPWAVKLCMEYFYPKPGTFVSVTREETKEVNIGFMESLSSEERQTFLRLWMKSKKGIPSFPSTDRGQDQCIGADFPNK